MTDAATRWIDRNTSALAAVAVVGTCLCFAAFGYLLVQNGKRSAEGAKARDLQIKRYPVSLKVYKDANQRGVITDADLDCFKTGLRCPKPSRTPSP